MSTVETHRPINADEVLRAIKTRRVVRDFTTQPIPEDAIHEILVAGRWAATGGNRRIHRFLVIRDPAKIHLVRSVAPGIYSNPAAIIFICIDRDLARGENVQVDRDSVVLIDVGTAAQNMLLAAHAMGIGACPATSFSRAGVAGVLGLPEIAIPEFVLLLGWPVSRPSQMAIHPKNRVRVEDLTYWEEWGKQS
jgi:nitroreductase